ncbi:MAG: inner membrane CreD family protein [Methylocystaceae bacterium]
MIKRLAAILGIFAVVSICWLILGSSVDRRTLQQDSTLRQEVGQLWGNSQRQLAPQVWSHDAIIRSVSMIRGGKTVTEKQTDYVDNYWPLDASDIKVKLDLEHRKKGLLWYSTYRVNYDSVYRIANETNLPKQILFDFQFPNSESVYDDFHLLIGGNEVKDVKITNGKIRSTFSLLPGETKEVDIAYKSQGLDEWWYDFGEKVNQVKNFSLVMDTNFKDIDFPQNSISPTAKNEAESGWRLSWKYSNLLTGVKIGMSMPHKLNPGPWVASVSRFAPISLLLFLFMLLIFSVTSRTNIHPVNYFFICAAYFSFHLLLAYLVDHLSIHAAFLISSIVSIFLVVSYMRLVVGNRFAYLQIGISQFVFLVLFSYTFFFKGYTGLTVTVLSILTLFIAMQLTARVNWEQVFTPKPEGDEKLIIE